MPSTGLNGPYKLDNETIEKVVTKKSAGAYALGYMKDSTFIVNYVGRSDDDINGRLKKWVGHNKYTHFKFKYYDSAKAAFDKECNLYHDWKNLDNKQHPDRTENKNWQCPRCDAFKEKK